MKDCFFSLISNPNNLNAKRSPKNNEMTTPIKYTNSGFNALFRLEYKGSGMVNLWVFDSKLMVDSSLKFMKLKVCSNDDGLNKDISDGEYPIISSLFRPIEDRFMLVCS